MKQPLGLYERSWKMVRLISIPYSKILRKNALYFGEGWVDLRKLVFDIRKSL